MSQTVPAGPSSAEPSPAQPSPAGPVLALRPRLASIPATLPFLDTLAQHCLACAGDDPVALSRSLVLLPTRRAARALADAFLRQSGGRALLLPRIVALGALDEAPFALAGALSLPPAIEPMHRLAILSRLILGLDGRHGAPRTADRAWTLAAELARLLDEAHRSEVDLAEALPNAVQAGFAEHWQVTTQFLSIVTGLWPALLAEQGRMDPTARQVALLRAQEDAWAQAPPDHDVIAAGTTGAIPSVARLLLSVARLPRGLVVLPGFDATLWPEPGEAALAESHPQAGMQRLVAEMGAEPGDVARWDGPAHIPTHDPVPKARDALLRLALLPADRLAQWRRRRAAAPGSPAAGPAQSPGEDLSAHQAVPLLPPGGLAGLRRLATADQQEEAAAIALVLRETLERPGERAALVTPDRELAARVMVELLRFGVVVDDSAGEPLAETPPAAFLRLLAQAVAERFAPVPLLSLLKHPFCAAGLAPARCREAARALELACLRGPRPAPGLDGLREALAARARATAQRAAAPLAASVAEPDPEAGDREAGDLETGDLEAGDLEAGDLEAGDPEAGDPEAGDREAGSPETASSDAAPGRGDVLLREAGALVGRLERCLAPLLALAARPTALAGEALGALVQVAEALATTDEEDGAARLWHAEDGAALSGHLAALADALAPGIADLPPQPLATLPGLLDASMEGQVVRSRRALRGRDGTEHPRLFVWGLLESRLQTVDLLVLGGLAEDVWPGAADPGPWMSRAMRTAVGLPSPEERVGQAAHDFAAACCAAPVVVLSCPRRRDGAPAVPSRWLARLDALLDGAGTALERHPATGWARAMDRPRGDARPASPPAPRPPVALRPRRLSVTEVETWLRDPYAIYARHVLRLRALPPIEESADAADYGSIVHAGLARFLDSVGTTWPADAGARLRVAVDQALDERGLRPALAAWWRPRLRRIADWAAEEEVHRRARDPASAVRPEISGSISIPGPAGPFELRGRADRVERHGDALSILDYKTGTPPSGADVARGWAPQLTLQAAMLLRGAFGPELAGHVMELAYWHLPGGFVAGEVREPFRRDAARMQDAAELAWDSLCRRVAAFDDPDCPYLSRPHPGEAPRFSDYAQLARVGEWALLDDAG